MWRPTSPWQLDLTTSTPIASSILTRDSSSLNMKGEFSYVKIEGSDDGVKRAEKLAKELELKKLDKKTAKEINDKILEQEDSAASGMGMIFD